jgi:hypothetical protein
MDMKAGRREGVIGQSETVEHVVAPAGLDPPLELACALVGELVRGGQKPESLMSGISCRCTQPFI